MSNEVLWLTRIAKLLVVAMGSMIVYLAYRGYRRHGSRPMLLISVGFALITFGAVVQGILFEFFGYGLIEATAIEALVEVVGFLMVIASVYTR